MSRRLTVGSCDTTPCFEVGRSGHQSGPVPAVLIRCPVPAQRRADRRQCVRTKHLPVLPQRAAGRGPARLCAVAGKQPAQTGARRPKGAHPQYLASQRRAQPLGPLVEPEASHSDSLASCDRPRVGVPDQGDRCPADKDRDLRACRRPDYGNTLKLLEAEELRALVAHEIGHEYVWVDYARASARDDHRRLKDLELLCDAIAIVTVAWAGHGFAPTHSERREDDLLQLEAL